MAATYGATAQPSRAGLKENTSGQGTLALKALTQPFLGFEINPKS